MRRAAAALALLAALASAAAADDARARALADADYAAGRLEERAVELEKPRLAGRYATEKDCLERFDEDGLVRDAKAGGGMIADLAPVVDGVVQYSFRYYTCLASVSRDDATCAGLAVFDDFARPHPKLECERYSKELRHVRALMTGDPAAGELCRASLVHPEDVEIRPADIAETCAIEAEYFRDPDAVCRRLKPYFFKPSQDHKCRVWYGSMGGDEAGCRTLGESDVKERCFAYAAFKRARDAGDAKRCEGRPLCELFMGGGTAACGWYARKISSRVCALVPRLAKERRAEREAVLAAVAAAEKGLAGIADGPDAAARRRRLDAVRRRVAALK